MIRKTIHFFGNVQGVGLRYTTCSVASGYDVSGFVRNLRGGSVELVAEGNVAEVERFIDTLRARMEGHIDREEIVDAPATGEFAGFGIR